MKKLTNKKGFTLMEMLIVVAIIVILVAVAVPSFTGALEKANNSTDDANFRTAESLAAMKAIEIVEANKATAATEYYLNVPEDGSNTGAKLSLVSNSAEDPVADANKATYEAIGDGDLGKSKECRGKYIKVTISETGDTTVAWVTKE